MQTYWAKWDADRPIDEICLDELTLKDGFTDSAAKSFLRIYDETIAFSGLGSNDRMAAMDAAGESDEDVSPPPPPPPASPKVGDLVNWESGGIIQFESGRVRGVSLDGSYVFVDGSSSGLPIKEITVIAQSSQPGHQLPPPAASNPVVGLSILFKQDTFTLDEGPVILQWPSAMSETSYEDFKDWIDLQMRKIKRSIPQ